MYGLVVGGNFGAAAVSAALLGGSADRRGPSVVIRRATWCIGVAILVLGLAARNALEMALLLVLSGAGGGVLQPALNVSVFGIAPKRRQGMAFGLRQMAVPLSVAVGGLAVPLLAGRVSWRAAFVGVAILTVVAGEFGARRARAAGGRAEKTPTAARERSRQLGYYAVGLGLGNAAATAYVAFIVGAGAADGLGESQAAALLIAGGALAACSRVGVGRLVDSGATGARTIVGTLLSVGAVGFLVLALAGRDLLLVGVVCAYGLGAGWNGVLNYLVVDENPDRPGRASGVVQVGGRLGAFVGPMVAGIAVQEGSYSSAWLVCAVFAVLAALTMVLGGYKARPTGQQVMV